MSTSSVVARYDRLKVLLLSLFFFAVMVGCAWVFGEALQGAYRGRRDPAVALFGIATTLVAGAPLVLIASIHLVKSLLDERVVFTEQGVLVVRGLRTTSFRLDELAAVYRDKFDAGRVVLEAAGGRRYYVRSTLMRESSASIVDALQVLARPGSGVKTVR